MNISASLGMLYLLSPGALGSTPPRYFIDPLCKLANIRYTSPLLIILYLFVPVSSTLNHYVPSYKPVARYGRCMTPLGGTSPFYPIIFVYRPSARDPTQIPRFCTSDWGLTYPSQYSYT
ncbi:uncharacterized protein EI90DRAFT_3077436 [Cantharellus anzutake]|uniref:uncharacterized protein n=1 Tax=Cantharellus anzutake TaxID=1750568 RepID=UPI0019069080|nr:uncharacterized protein EI90DRAFT_3077436 [Cantharellus anzutake]KAF8322834.1 hypothetical protein EI90DRAFT_3077436 [Cantharellus anzutake]